MKPLSKKAGKNFKAGKPKVSSLQTGIDLKRPATIRMIADLFSKGMPARSVGCSMQGTTTVRSRAARRGGYVEA